MIRYPHYWWQSKGGRFPAQIAVVDCDSVSESAKPPSRIDTEKLVGWHISLISLSRGERMGQSEARGDSASGLWCAISQLLNSSGRTWVFMTPFARVAKLLDLWDMLEDRKIILAGRDWKTGQDADVSGDYKTDAICVLEDPPTIIVCGMPYRKGRLTILDMRNYGIEPLGRELNARDRCNGYLAGLGECVQTLRKSGHGALRATAASQAVSALRSRYAVVRLHCHVNPGATALERNSSYGGRCECYRIGEISDAVYHVDVRNLYPSLCLTLPIPVSLRRYHGTERDSRITDPTRASAAIADVEIRTNKPIYPCRTEGITIYPTGRFRTVLCGPELCRALESGVITKWYASAEYTTAPALSEFYTEWLALLVDARAQGSPLLQQWIKRVMVSLVGKFGEQGRRWVAAPARPEQGPFGEWEDDGPDGSPARFRNIGYCTQREEKSGESYWSIPAISAWITAAGRCRLWDYIETARRANVWYCDTDAILCNREGFDRLLSSGHIRDGEAGYLRLIGRYSRCFVYGIRHYQLDKTVVCAGVPRGAIEPGESRYDYFWRQKVSAELAFRGKPTGERVGMMYPRPEEYRHGVVSPDGRVTPMRLGDG